jgi:CRISP-associated protein Cas1
LKVWQLVRNGEDEVAPDTKRALVHTLYEDMQTSAGATPVMVCMQRLATSLAQVYLGERDKLDLPLPGLPLSLGAGLDE